MVTADGMPVVWAARLLGTYLKERITGADLVPGLAREAAKRGKSIYLLGGRGDVAKQAADILTKEFPKLEVAGISSPFVHVEGDEMMDAEDVDIAVVDAINQAEPDILFLGFGNPKQELWFERNRHRLKAGVSIGIGGTYEFITGRVKRAPEWIQKSGFEWIYRITQDPMRLFKRYFVGFFKFGTMILPSILYLKYRTGLLNLSWKKEKKNLQQISNDLMDESITASNQKDLSVNVIPLDERIDSAWVNEKGIDFISRIEGRYLILDFSRVNFVDSTGIGFLLKLYRRFEKAQEGLIFSGVQKPVMRTLQLIRVIDLFQKIIVNNVDDAFALFSQSKPKLDFFYFMEKSPGMVTLHLFGHLDSERISQERLNAASLLDGIKERHCILNLKGLNYAGNAAVVLFLKLQKSVELSGGSFVLCVPRGNVKQMLKVSKVEHLFSIEDNLVAARERLESGL